MISPLIVRSLQLLFAKETNELAISALIDALMAHQDILLKNDTAPENTISKLISSGLADKRAKIKSGWAVASSGIIWRANNGAGTTPALVTFSKSISKSLFLLFNEVASNPVQASQSGTITAGYAIGAVSLGRWLQWQDPQLSILKRNSVLILVQLVKSQGILNITVAISPKPSFLLNERIYTKLTAERDQFWAINALEAAAMTMLTEMETAWAIAAIFFIANPKLSRTVRSTAKSMLENVVAAMAADHRQKCADVVILGIEEWLRQISEERKDSPAMIVGVSSLDLLRDVARSILPKKMVEEKTYVFHVLIRIFVLANHPKLPRHQWSWIDIARKANVDPGQLTADHKDEFMNALALKWWPTEKVDCSLTLSHFLEYGHPKCITFSLWDSSVCHS